jgi:molybdenum cofactor biosynthesis enzyme MoaA
MLEYKDPLNSFSALKGLTYHTQYKQIIDWMDGKTDYLPPPLECNLDPFAECQLDCVMCNVQRYIKNHREEVGKMRKLPIDYCFRLVMFLKKWGVHALCVSGGGEPTLHDGLAQILHIANDIELETSLVTNMCDIKRDVMTELLNSRWVAMSVDSCDRELYKQIKGRDRFFDVISNIQILANLKCNTHSKLDIAFKMLVLEGNYTRIFETCELAKELGCNTFHVRPADMERSDIKGHKKQVIDIDVVADQFNKCHEIEDENFAVYTITHKFDANFHNIQRFKRCLSTPLLIPILTDGNFYACVDVKMNKKFLIGSASPNPESILDVWGSEKHREFIKSIVPCNDCVNWRCTFQKYHEYCEKVVLEDRLYRNFP